MTRQTAAAALLLAAVAPHARAQNAPADSLPARAGTWAFEAGVGTNTSLGASANVGALRFLGARSALTFNLFGGYSSQTRDSTPQFEGGTTRSAQLGANVGVRRYSPVRGGLAGFGGVGATGSYWRFSSGQGQTQTRIGGYGELGAAYLVVRRLTINASTALTVARVGGRSESLIFTGIDQPPTPVSARLRGWEVGAGGVRLSATLYF